jgi:predicted RNA-binding Zn-ribbon protein involved in translation (DUF1610 family)
MLPKIWIRIPYLGNRGNFLLKSCLNKIQRFFSKPVKFITIYDTKQFSYFVSNKDKLPPLSRSNLVYKIACPGCGKTYIGMTQRCLSVRLKERATTIFAKNYETNSESSYNFFCPFPTAPPVQC